MLLSKSCVYGLRASIYLASKSLPGCGSATPCPLHESWIETRASIKGMLERTTLSELAREGKQNKFRLMADGSFNWN